MNIIRCLVVTSTLLIILTITSCYKDTDASFREQEEKYLMLPGGVFTISADTLINQFFAKSSSKFKIIKNQNGDMYIESPFDIGDKFKPNISLGASNLNFNKAIDLPNNSKYKTTYTAGASDESIGKLSGEKQYIEEQFDGNRLSAINYKKGNLVIDFSKNFSGSIYMDISVPSIIKKSDKKTIYTKRVNLVGSDISKTTTVSIDMSEYYISLGTENGVKNGTVGKFNKVEFVIEPFIAANTTVDFVANSQIVTKFDFSTLSVEEIDYFTGIFRNEDGSDKIYESDEIEFDPINLSELTSSSAESGAKLNTTNVELNVGYLNGIGFKSDLNLSLKVEKSTTNTIDTTKVSLGALSDPSLKRLEGSFKVKGASEMVDENATKIKMKPKLIFSQDFGYLKKDSLLSLKPVIKIPLDFQITNPMSHSIDLSSFNLKTITDGLPDSKLNGMVMLFDVKNEMNLDISFEIKITDKSNKVIEIKLNDKSDFIKSSKVGSGKLTEYKLEIAGENMVSFLEADKKELVLKYKTSESSSVFNRSNNLVISFAIGANIGAK